MTRRGFTLLEVVVALAILAVALVAVLDINAQSVASHVYARRLTVATLLARSKMVDLEQKLHDKGMNVDDEEDSGDFAEEGWPSYRWRAKIIAPRTNGLSPEQLFGAILNLPLGDGSSGGPGSLLAGIFGASGKAPAGGPRAAADTSGNSTQALLGAMGPMAGMASAQFTQMVDQLQKSVREVQLTVTWKEGRLTESFDLVTHVVSLGPGSDRNGGAAAVAGVGPPSETWVRPDGTPARAPTICPSGTGLCDSDGTQLMTSAQRNISAASATGPKGQPRLADPFTTPKTVP
jgi:general secretion pathway protein I